MDPQGTQKEHVFQGMASAAKPQGAPPNMAQQLLRKLNFMAKEPSLHGRTATCMENWAKVTKNKWVLEAETGYKLDLIEELMQAYQPVTQLCKWTGACEVTSTRCNQTSATGGHRLDILFNCLFGAKDGWSGQASHQFETPPCIPETPALDDRARPEGSILCNPCQLGAPTLPEVHNHVRDSVLAIWVGISTKNIH